MHQFQPPIPEVKRTRCEDDHSAPSIAEVKNQWSYTSTPQRGARLRYVFMVSYFVKHRDKLILLYLTLLYPTTRHCHQVTSRRPIVLIYRLQNILLIKLHILSKFILYHTTLQDPTLSLSIFHFKIRNVGQKQLKILGSHQLPDVYFSGLDY